VNRWNRVQNRTGGTGTVLPSPNKLIGKVVIAFEFNENSKYGFLHNKLHALTFSGSFGFPSSALSAL